MLNKAIFKKAIIFLLPIPLVIGEVLYLARESVQNNLNHLLEKNVQIADEILFQIETENRTALLHPRFRSQFRNKLLH
ncbi:EAL domain-containing protein, partial [Vibrio alginolyticus]|nr:EAL domain-containing protein [Vibrio alginolyticus]